MARTQKLGDTPAKKKSGKALNKTQNEYILERLAGAADALENGNAHRASAMFDRMADYIKENPDADLYDFIVWLCRNVDGFE